MVFSICLKIKYASFDPRHNCIYLRPVDVYEPLVLSDLSIYLFCCFILQKHRFLGIIIFLRAQYIAYISISRKDKICAEIVNNLCKHLVEEWPQ